MNYGIYRDNISLFLFDLASIIKVHNSKNRTDKAVDAEDLICRLLNQAFGWNLTNANKKKKNQEGFDLEDKKKHLYIQVTSNQSHSSKKSSAIKSFTKKAKPRPRKRFIVFFANREVSKAITVQEKFKDFTYEGWDLEILLKKLLEENTTIAKLKLINDILQEAMAGKIILDPSALTTRDYIPAPQPVPISKNGLQINRSSLLEKLALFATGGNGLVVGGPGEGKTYLLRALQREYITQKRQCYIVPIDALNTATNDEIAAELGGTGNWLKAFKSTHVGKKGYKNLLIFDAFDTAKDAALKTAVLKQIRNAINELSPAWNVLVSARLYEATKSPNLIDLFPEANVNNPISSRHFEVPLLELDEIKSVLKKGPPLTAFSRSTKSLQSLIRIPYFLSLFEQLINTTTKDHQKQIESVETEEHLLHIFWNKKVTPETSSVLFIEKLTRHLSKQCKHSCQRAEIVNTSDAAILDNIIGNGILSSASINSQNITFSHNILLDYAISLYGIPHDPQALKDHLEQNARHWLLFRPSYIYFLSFVWRIDRKQFWQIYNHLMAVDSAIFRLFRLTILNYVLASNYATHDEIISVFSTFQATEKARSYQKLLAVLRYLNKAEVPEKEYHLLAYISEHLEDIFIWDAGFLIDRAIDQASKTNNKAQLHLMSKAAINFMQYYLTHRTDTLSKPHLDGNASIWAIRNLCNTYPINKNRAERLILEFLDILKDPEYPIRPFFQLAEQLNTLLSNNPQFATRIFLRIYGHIENSQETTSISNDVAFSLRSNRQQDFNNLYNFLERFYPGLLRQSPIHFIPVGIDIINEHNLASGYYTKKPTGEHFSFLNKSVSIFPDFLHYQNHYDKENGEQSFITKIFDFFKELVSQNKFHALREFIILFITNAKAGSLWCELIRLLAAHPKPLQQEAYAVLTCPRLLLDDSCTSTVAELIPAEWPYFNAKERTEIRRTIMSLGSEKLTQQDIDRIKKNSSAAFLPGQPIRTKPPI